MPSWKKVIVSGSQAQLAAATASMAVLVGTNQIITTAQSTTKLTGSFTGSFAGDGSGLTNVTATAVFPTTAKTDLSTSDQIYINDGTNKYITYGNLAIDLAGSGAGTSNLTTTDTGDSLALTSQISVTGVTASFTGSLTGALIGTSSWATNATTATTATNATNTAVTDTQTGTGPYYITFVDNTTGNLAQRVDSTGLTYNATTNTITATSSYATQALSASFASTAPYSGLTGTPAGIVSASVLAAGSGQGAVTLTTNGVSSGDVTATGLSTAGNPTFAGLTISTNALAVNNTNGITTNAATFPIAPSATAISIGTTSNTTITLGTINSTTIVPGNLTVQGSTTIISSSNLTISDKFVFISSGSTSGTNEGGIVVSNASGMTGSAFYYEGTDTRWALAPAVGATDTGATPNSYLVSVSGSTVDPSGNPLYGGSSAGYGNMYVNTTSGDIWIYS